MRRILVATLCLLAACSGGGGSEEAAGPAVTQQATTTTAAAPKSVPAKELVAALKHSGLPVGKVICYTEETDPNDLLGRPGGYTEKCDWADRREEQYSPDDPVGGSVELFDTSEGAAERMEYLEGFEGAGAFSTGYTWVVPDGGVTVLRIDQELTPKQAAAYKAAALTELN